MAEARKNGKKTKDTTAPAGGYNVRKAGEFVGEVKAELKRVSWTSKEELTVYTKIVVGATFALGLSLYIVDIVMQKLVIGFGAFFHLVFG